MSTFFATTRALLEGSGHSADAYRIGKTANGWSDTAHETRSRDDHHDAARWHEQASRVHSNAAKLATNQHDREMHQHLAKIHGQHAEYHSSNWSSRQ